MTFEGMKNKNVSGSTDLNVLTPFATCRLNKTLILLLKFEKFSALSAQIQKPLIKLKAYSPQT
jgi:hypothetical protein